jgi:hypothetical protein
MKMKSFKLAAYALLAGVAISSCKYEEGPGISLRSKRDRVANEWKVNQFIYDGNDVTASLNDTFFSTIIKLYRTGFYGVTIIDKDGNTSHTGNWPSKANAIYNHYQGARPRPITDMGNNGKWTFDYRHDKIQIYPELSTGSDSFNVRGAMNWGIIMLKEKQLKVIGKDRGSVDWSMDLLPLNSEPYWF